MPNLATLGTLGLRAKISPAQIQTIFISTATFENSDPLTQLGQPLLPPSLTLARSYRHGRLCGRMPRWAAPGAGSGCAWVGMTVHKAGMQDPAVRGRQRRALGPGAENGWGGNAP